MQGKERIQSFLDAFNHGGKIEFYEGACHGLRIALASIEMEEKERGQARESNHKGNIWDTKHSNETSLRSNEKREKRGSQTVERSSK